MEEMTIIQNNKVTNEELDTIRKHQEQLNSILNEVGYIVPGLGDCGDRLFGTK